MQIHASSFHYELQTSLHAFHTEDPGSQIYPIGPVDLQKHVPMHKEASASATEQKICPSWATTTSPLTVIVCL